MAIAIKQLNLPAGTTTNCVVDGAALTGAEAAELIAGKDGAGNAQFIITDTTGNQVVVGAGVAGAPTGGVVSVQGVSSGAALPVSAVALPLPSLASTSTLQTTGNTSLGNIDTKTPALGQAVMASSSPVVIASNQSSLPVTVGNLSLAVNATINNTAASMPLSNLASTSALQTTGNSSLSSIDTKTPALVTGRVPVDGSGVTQPVSNAALTSIDTKLPALASGRVPVGFYDTAGTGLGTSTNPLRVDTTNTTPQAVTGTVTATVTGVALNATLTGGTARTQITDGSTNAAVKAASTPAVAADPALVVALSPNQRGATAGAAATPVVTTTSSTVLAANANRIGACISNGGSVTVFLYLSSSAAALGAFTVALAPNAYYELPQYEGVGCYRGAINAIVASGSPSLMVQEFT